MAGDPSYTHHAMDVKGARLTRSAGRIVIDYATGIVAGVAVAVFASATGAPDNVYVMFAVLLVVMAALLGGTGPAITVAITAVVGDDIVLSGRLPPLEQWKDEVLSLIHISEPTRLLSIS